MSPSTARNRSVLRLLAVSLLAGLLLAGVLLPFVGGAGFASKAAADSYLSLPTDLQTPPLPQASRLLAADGSVLAVFYEQDRQLVPLSAVPQVARQALVDIEDSRFYTNSGIDVRGTARALAADLGSAGARQGGSTLTQQYVKNVLVQSADTPADQKAARAPTLSRKLREARYALALDRKLSKDQILERYLNIAYFGDGAYGIGAAARHYFGLPVQQLTLAQAALLAGIVENPGYYDPVTHPDHGLARRSVVVDRMVALGDVKAEDAAVAKAAPLALRPTMVPQGCEVSSAPYFCDYVRTSLLASPALGATPDARFAKLYRGGLTVSTTLEPTAQDAAQRAVNAGVPPSATFAAAVDMVQPGTGAVQAMAVDRTYGDDRSKNQTKVNLATGGGSGFQAGSTFKVFVLASALQQGTPLSLTLNAPHTYASQKFSNFTAGARSPYSVSNAGDSEAGVFNVVGATWDSVNTFYLQLEERTGLSGPADLAQAMGVRRADGKPLAKVPSFTLGTNEVSPLAMASAYATFAAHGMYCPATGVSAVTDAAGKGVGSWKPQCTSAMAPTAADQETSVLRGVVDGPDPLRTGKNASIGRPAAGKTGTTEGYGAAWFDGYTPQLAAAVWVGDPSGGQGHPLAGVSINGQYYKQVYGGDIPAAIWRNAMSGALANQPVTDFSGAGAGLADPTPGPLASPAALGQGGGGPQPTTPAVTGLSPLPTGSGAPGGARRRGGG